MLQNERYRTIAVILSITLLLFAFISLFLGSEYIQPKDVLKALVDSSNKGNYFIVYHLRLTRIITAILAGGALSVSGLMLQSYFRNELVGPSILGISSGSGLMIALLLLSGTTFSFLPFSLPIFAIIGAILILLFILAISRKIGSGVMLLIIGIMTGAFINAIITFLQYFAASKQLQNYIIWTMGSTNQTSYQELLIMGISVLALLIFSIFLINDLNALLLGEKYASSLGINLKKSKIKIIAITGLLTAIITAYCGPIAFVGLAAPHLVKLVLKTANHRYTIPFSFLAGSIFMVIADSLAELPFYSFKLPLNAVTSFLGAPVIIMIIFKNKTIR